MSKCYRPSLSLANKCRVGFATAVLLIIGIALYFPSRWMDKRVEQDKREIAQIEVAHVLDRHFRLAPDMDPNRPLPPLALGPGEAATIQAGRWNWREYPPLLKAAGIGGSVTVLAHIDASGRVVEAEVAVSSGNEALDRAALAAVKRFRFTPALNRDRKVSVWVRQRIVFEVK